MERLHKLSPNVWGSKTTFAESFPPNKFRWIAFLQTLFLVGYCVHIEILIQPCHAAFAGEPLIEPLVSVYGENSKVHLIREILNGNLR